VVRDISAGSGISATTANGIATLANTGILSITQGTGITATTTNGVATITNSAVVRDVGGGTGILVSTTNGVATITNTAVVRDISAGSGISATTANGVATLANTGILSITQGTGITATTTNGVATITNTAVVRDISAGSGISATTANGVATLANTGILSVAAGTGISVSTTSGVATITSTATAGTTQATVLQNIREDNLALGEVGALPRKPDYWATNWSIVDEAVRSHYDSYLSVDGKVIATASGNFAIRYSTNYGTSWNDGNVSSTLLYWFSICGTTNGSKLFAFGRTGTSGNQILVLYTSVNQGATWTQVTSGTFTGLNAVNRVRCSGDGKYLIANVGNVGTGVRYLSSSDSGATWELKTINATIDTGFTQGVNVSRSGAVQYITWTYQDGNVSRVYRSLDYGTTWTQVNQNNGNELFTYIESDSTGRFVWVARYVNINTLGSAGYRSDDYGVTWSQTGFGSCEDIWVSATGQFAAGVSIANPSQSNNRFLCITVDYGMTTQYVNLGNTTTHRTINGSADGSVLVMGSVNFSEGNPSFSGDGKIRIARQALQNIQDLSVVGGTIAKSSGVYTLTNDYGLHYTGIVTADNNTNTYNLSWANIVSPINLETHNIRYEIFISFNFAASQIEGGVAFQMGLNGVNSTGYTAPADSRWRTAVTNWTNTIVAGQANPDTAQEFNQTFVNRFYCGERRASTWSTAYRNRVHLKGEISMNRRLNAEAGITDNSIQSRIIVNQFNCEHFVDAGADQWYIYAEATANNSEQYNRIHGTALWNARANNLWANNLATGISSINILMQTIADPITYMPRGAEIQFRIYKENKGIANSV
jgi:hypothetical protein